MAGFRPEGRNETLLFAQYAQECMLEFQMKRAAFIAVAIAVALPASGGVPTAFSAALSSPTRIRHDRHKGHVEVAHALTDQRLYRDEHSENSTASGDTRRPQPSGMDAKVARPSVEWDCSGGDAGCSWEPYGWRKDN